MCSSDLAGLAAAAGLSRYAPGAVAATEQDGKPDGNPKGVPQPGEPLTLTRAAWVTGLEPIDPRAGLCVLAAYVDPRDGVSSVLRIQRFDDAGRLAEVSPAMFPPANG